MLEDITTNLYHFIEVFNINKYRNMLLDCVSILRSSDGYYTKDFTIFNNVQVEYRKFDENRSTLEFRLRESSLCISGVMLVSYKGTVDDLKVILASIERDIKVVEYSIDYNKFESYEK